MKKSVQKDLKKRLLVYKEEKKNLLLKFITYSTSLTKEIRYKAFNIFLNKSNLNIYKSRIKNRCIFTARGRSILSDIKISRITFRKLASNGSLLGIRKSSW